MKSRIGWNAIEMGIYDKPYYVHLNRQMNCAWTLMIDSPLMCEQLLAVVPNVIDRRIYLDGRQDEGNVWKKHPYWTGDKDWSIPENYVKALVKTSPDPRTVKYPGGNEPNFGNIEEARIYMNWLARVINLLMNWRDPKTGKEIKFRAIFGNFAPANERADWADAGVYDPVLREIAKYPGRAYYGGHAYAYGWLPSGTGHVSPLDIKPPRDLSAMHQNRWAKANQINPRTAPHILRTSIITNLRSRKIGLGDTPTVLTEIGWGKMSDLLDHDPALYQTMDAHYPPSDGARSLDGGMSLRNLYQKAYPHWSLEESLVEQLAWMDTIYPENVVGMLIYAYGTGDDGQNYAGARTLHDLMVKRFGAGENWALCMASPRLSAWVNLRAGGSKQTDELARIYPSTPCLVWFEGMVTDDKGYRWLPMQITVKGVATRGYSRRDLLRVWYVK